MSGFSPREIVSELDRFIVGQNDAKRSVAIALRNRWRRLQLSDEMREIAREHLGDLDGWSLERTRIEIPLQAHSAAEFSRGLGQVDTPIERNHICAGFRH